MQTYVMEYFVFLVESTLPSPLEIQQTKKKILINGIWRALVVFLVFLRVSAHYYVSRGPNR